MIPHNITKETYFSQEVEKEYLGSSSFKAWDMTNLGTEVFGNFVQGGCEARESAKRQGKWEDKGKEAFLVGSYIHAWSEGKEAFDKFIADNYTEIYQKNGKPYAAFVRADAMIETLRNSKLVQTVRDTKEKEMIMVGEISGQKFKIAVDIINLEKGYFADLKTTANIYKTGYKNGERVSFLGVYDYKMQFAIYAEIIRQNLGYDEGVWLDPFVIVVDKQEIPDHEVIYMGKHFIQEKLDELITKLPRIVAARNGEVEPERCERCDYCRSTKVLERPIGLDEFESKIGLY